MHKNFSTRILRRIISTTLLLSTICFAGCGKTPTSEESSIHTHTFSNRWSYDNEYHWHESTCGHDEISDKASHIFNSVVTDPTYTSGGYTTHTCTVCGYSYVDSETEMLTHTITFDSNGGSQVVSQHVKHGEKIQKPADPTREGYTFVNWTYQNEEWSFIGYVVTDDITLVANWTINVYNITYELNGKTNNPLNPSTYTVEDEVTLYDIDDSQFLCWTLNGESIEKISKGTTGDLVLVANWREYYNVWIVVWNDPEDYPYPLGRVSGDMVYEYNTTVKVTATPSGENTFDGWYDSDYVKLSEDLEYSFLMPRNDIKLYAKFSYTPYDDEGTNNIVFSDYEESAWFSIGGSNFEKEIDNDELTINYLQEDMNTGDYANDGWCLANLLIRTNFVDGDALKIKIKIAKEHSEYASAVINITEKNGVTWRSATPFSSLSDEYTEVIIPFNAFYTVSIEPYQSTTDRVIKSVYYLSFGVEREFGSGMVSFKGFEIVNYKKEECRLVDSSGLIDDFESYSRDYDMHKIWNSSHVIARRNMYLETVGLNDDESTAGSFGCISDSEPTEYKIPISTSDSFTGLSIWLKTIDDYTYNVEVRIYLSSNEIYSLTIDEIERVQFSFSFSDFTLKNADKVDHAANPIASQNIAYVGFEVSAKSDVMYEPVCTYLFVDDLYLNNAA